jgi:hypothetical protein
MIMGNGGDGIHSDSRRAPMLQNCVVAGNKRAGIFGDSVSANNCSVYANHGAGISGRGLNVANSIIRANSQAQVEGTATVIYSNIEGGCSGLGNTDTDPCFVEPGSWDTNGTPQDSNDDFWVNGDYHLKSRGWRWDTNCGTWTWDDFTSRCIDAGNPGSPLGEELLFIAQDPNKERGENLRINMGAFGGTAEASIAPYDWALLGDITNDGIVDGRYYAHQAQDWLTPGTEQPGDFNRNGIVDTNDVGLFVADWLKTTTWHE